MKVEKTLVITPTGVLAVTVTPTPSRGYLGTNFAIEVRWSPIEDARIEITYGDGTSETVVLAPVVYVFYKKYAFPGTYTVNVNVTGLFTGSTGSGSTSIEVIKELAVTFAADRTSGPIPLAVIFTCGASEGYLNYTWTLDPGDGSPAYSGTRTATGTWTQSHTYNKVSPPEGFTAKLTVTDALGVSAVYRIAILSGLTYAWDQVKAWWNMRTSTEKISVVGLAILGVAGGIYAAKRKR